MENLYYADDLVITRQKDGSVFFIRPNEQPQVMLTLTSEEWLHTLTMEMMKNPRVEQIHEVLAQHEATK